VTPRGRGQEIAAKDLADRADALLRRATLLPVLLLVPLVFLPLRQPTDLFLDRAVNLVLHLAGIFLLFALTRRLCTQLLVAPATVLIFAVHPVHVDAIAVVAGRADILATASSLAALLAFTYAGAWPRHGKIVFPGVVVRHAAAWCTGAFLFLALESSAVALSTPAMLLALDWLFRPTADSSGRRWSFERMTALVPSALALLVYVVLRMRGLAWTPGVPPTEPASGGPGAALALLARKVGLLFYPLNLYAEPSESLLGPRTELLRPLPMLGLLVLVILVWVAVRPFVGGSRTGIGAQASIAALLFLLPYSMTSGLSGDLRIVFSERYLYFPSAGFCLLLGLAIGAVSTGWFPGRPRRSAAQASGSQLRLAALVLAALVSGFSILTWARCLEWRNGEPGHRATFSANDIACATRLGSLDDRMAPHTATPDAPARINSGIRVTVTPPMA